MDSKTLVSEFRSRQETKKSEATAKSYGQALTELSKWLLNPGRELYDSNERDRDSKELWEATTADLRIHLRHLLSNGGYAGGTVNNRVIAINVFYQELEKMAEEGYSIPSVENPAEDLDVSGWSQLKNGTKKEQELKELHYLLPEEVKSLRENVTSPTLRNELIIRLLYQTGLRRAELAETRVEDIDTDSRTINVRATKTHLNRTVRYQPNLDTLLSRWLNVNRPALATAGSEYLFPTSHSERIYPEYINQIVKDAADAADLQDDVFTDAGGRTHVKITAHTLRHSYAVQSLKNGMDTRTLQKLMGHAQIETTEKYLRLSKDDVLEAARHYGAGSE
ncbi:tyrosine-type recombinase/integrase [Halopenitus persicus]|uniref:Integrase/recombinase XerD n=1 Tax=Halopenitus persicus TaxID=1048396 RepID=A0A1H3JMY7_9EURY|nr:tyrosine-type recombinase/integrase [Halopenitus persicus]SDY41247.1 integrase/recombinase XerD [Halopenitus persicus]